MSAKFVSNGLTFKVKWKPSERGCDVCAFRGCGIGALCMDAPDCCISAQGSEGGFKIVWVRKEKLL